MTEDLIPKVKTLLRLTLMQLAAKCSKNKLRVKKDVGKLRMAYEIAKVERVREQCAEHYYG